MKSPGPQLITTPSGRLIKAWVQGVPLEDSARTQLLNAAELPFIHRHIAVMPDVHMGIGATVGSVIPTVQAIIPAAVGVDIGCGMMAARTSLRAEDLPMSLKELRTNLEVAIPHGRTNKGGGGDRGAWHNPPKRQKEIWASELKTEFNEIIEAHPSIIGRSPNHLNHLGTLGSGNHFVEVCLDEAGRVWIMLHSGSRGIGNRIGTYFIELAKVDMRLHEINLPDADLSYLSEGTVHFDDYVKAVGWAQKFARLNRQLMMEAAMQALTNTKGIPPFSTDDIAVNCHHNYVEKETHFGTDVWVTRKGAVRAGEGELGIIPGSMGTRSYIVRGKGNEESFHSCSHGAGRVMSRTEAKRRFTLEDHARATAGIECRKDKDVIDETPAAYKDIDAVMEAQSDLVEIVHTLKQIVCVKG